MKESVKKYKEKFEKERLEDEKKAKRVEEKISEIVKYLDGYFPDTENNENNKNDSGKRK